MGVFGTQLEDGTISLAKLDAALQALQVPSPFKNGTGTNSVFGPGASDTTFPDGFAQGTGTAAVLGPHSFAQGTGVQAGYTCFSQGYAYAGHSGTTGFAYASFTQGAGVRAEGDYCFAQGAFYIDLQGDRVFGQGKAIYQTNTLARDVFIQGSSITLSGDVRASFVQGKNITSANRVTYGFMQGIRLTWGPNVSRIFMQGDYLQCYSNQCFIQGGRAGLGNRIYANCDNSFAQGVSIYFDAGSKQCFGQGNNLGIDGETNFAQGQGIGITGNVNFGQGMSNNITGSYSFTQGRTCYVTGDRSFARGRSVNVPRDDQTGWGSNRFLGSPFQAQAQKNWIVKHVETTDATQTTLLPFDLQEDQGYDIHINLIARNTDTDDEVASFVLSQAVAYRNTGGAAVLVGSPVALTRLDSGGGASSWLADLVQSGNDVLLRVTGDALDKVEWCCDFKFVEVRG